MGDVAKRMFMLFRALQEGECHAGEELAERFGTSTRTIRSDVARLRALGFEIVSTPGPRGEYRLTRGRTMPPLFLDDDEAVAAAVGLAVIAGTADPASPIAGGAFDVAAARALAKLESFLPERLHRRIAVEGARIQPLLSLAPPVDAALLVTVTRSIAARFLLKWSAKTREGLIRLGFFEPYRLLFRHPHWYVVGFDRRHHAWTLQRLDEVDAAGPSRRRFDPRPLPPGRRDDLIPHVYHGWHDAELRVHAPLRDLEEALRHEAAEVDALGADDFLVRIRGTHRHALLMRLALHGIEFRVVSPAAFADDCRRLAEKLARAAG
ncbi:helix-turn-helix transcriptional regulator [Tomitella fengzijianii]|nr:WYL domain-containing protein [Tomitella fengzijianii]